MTIWEPSGAIRFSTVNRLVLIPVAWSQIPTARSSRCRLDGRASELFEAGRFEDLVPVVRRRALLAKGRQLSPFVDQSAV
jgi:hypothetical protein